MRSVAVVQHVLFLELKNCFKDRFISRAASKKRMMNVSDGLTTEQLLIGDNTDVIRYVFFIVKFSATALFSNMLTFMS